jgi:hypothetical protein
MKNVLLIALLLILENGIAQLDFKIENIIVSKIIEELDDDMIHEDFAEGPGITVYCSIINNSSDTIILSPSNFELVIIFTFENIEYSTSPPNSVWVFMDTDTLTILPSQKFDFNFYDNYLLGSEFYKWNKIPLTNIKKIDHTKEVIATLPTLKVRYRDENIDIITNEIKNITIGDIIYIYK